MLAAFVTSCAFLTCYFIYHAHVGSVPFGHAGILRTVYLSILVTHTTLAAAVPPLAIITLSRGLSSRFDQTPRHRPLDPAYLAVRECDRRGGLSDAVQAVAFTAITGYPYGHLDSTCARARRASPLHRYIA